MEWRLAATRTVRAIVAALLVALLLGLSGLAVTGAAIQHSGPMAFLARGETAQQLAAASTSATVSAAPAVAPSSQASPPRQTGGLIDARSAVKLAGPAVVTVVNTLATNTRQSGSPSSPIAPTAMGSGLIVDSEGHIVTNNHVVQNQTSLQVIFSDGKKAPARLVGTDAVSDLAVIKVDAAVPAVAVFGDSDKLELGQPVVAIGSALGNFRNTVTAGVVSGLNRNLDDPSAPALRNLIQTDAAINHGNSGGPLIDLNGRVVGINVAVVRTTTGTLGDVAEGLGFAIPANSVQTVSAQLIKSGVVSRPFVGISYQLITPQIAAYYDLPRNDGILVTDVQAGSPAAKAGLTANSIITKFDGVTLNSDTSMLELLMKHKIGDNVSLTYLPSGASAEKTVMVVLAERPNGQ